MAHQINNKLINFAVKSVPKNKIDSMSTIEKEIIMLRKLDHPNIVNYIESFEDAKYYHIVMEYCSGGEIIDTIIERGYLDEFTTMEYFRNILSAVLYCHNNGVCHRDLKPDNFLLKSKDNDAEIKIIDFGLSHKFIKDDLFQTLVGSAFYVAPEVLSRKYD